MDIKRLIEDFGGCSCGREHHALIKAVEIGEGLLDRTADILNAHGFPHDILLVADNNTLNASAGLTGALTAGGFKLKLRLFDDLRVADMADVDALTELCGGGAGILSVGSGSLNDICRLAALRADKRFAIFATAPSMDGFASDSAPITRGNFKISYPARCPEIIIGDTNILAAAPAELKSAGFGDIIAKYIAIVDWKIAHHTSGEYYCEKVAALTKTALNRVVSMADRVAQNDTNTAAAIMEALVMAGLAMSLAGCTRPASGAEHIISHFWEIKKLEQGLLSDFHGKKVGVASLLTADMYQRLAGASDIDFHAETPDWDDIYRAYGTNFADDLKKMNNPTVTAKTSPEVLSREWQKICGI
ncbi:MAG: iron-containing alcohol dehydrogenase, partial [Oscillospiraceae bacterium]|nr:iron-containing alcohol dehydrogenase [Oscillospiraceae bacterium]